MTYDIGSILRASRLTSVARVKSAQSRMEETGCTLLEQLVIDEALDEDAFADFLAEHHECDRVDLAELEQLSVDALSHIPADMAGQLRVIPLEHHGQRLVVAMEEPGDDDAVDTLAHFTGKLIIRQAIAPTDLARALKRYYHLTLAFARLHPRAEELRGNNRSTIEINYNDVDPGTPPELRPRAGEVEASEQDAGRHSTEMALPTIVIDSPTVEVSADVTAKRSTPARGSRASDVEIEYPSRQAITRELPDDSEPEIEIEYPSRQAITRELPVEAAPPDESPSAIPRPMAIIDSEQVTNPFAGTAKDLVDMEEQSDHTLPAALLRAAIDSSTDFSPGSLRTPTGMTTVSSPRIDRATRTPTERPEGAIVSNQDREATAHTLLLHLQQIERAAHRDEIVSSVLEFLGSYFENASFFPIRKGQLSTWQWGNSDDTETASVDLSLESTLRGIVTQRVSFHGRIRDARSRDFLIATFEQNPDDIHIWPVSIRSRCVGIVCASEAIQPLEETTLLLLTGAMGMAFERLLLVRKHSDLS